MTPLEALALVEQAKEALRDAHNHAFSVDGYGGTCNFCKAILGLDQLSAFIAEQEKVLGMFKKIYEEHTMPVAEGTKKRWKTAQKFIRAWRSFLIDKKIEGGKSEKT